MLLYLLLPIIHGEVLKYMDILHGYGKQSGRRQPGEELHTEFCSVFLFDFFPGVREWGDRASSRGLVLRLGLRHRRSDLIVITDRSSSLCVHGPPTA